MVCGLIYIALWFRITKPRRADAAAGGSGGVYMQIGAKVRRLRTQRGLTMEELADR